MIKNKKILSMIGILVVIIALLGIYIIQVYKPAIPAKEQLLTKFSGFEIQYQEKKAQGYDVAESEWFAGKAKQSFDRKDYNAANRFLDNAFEALEKANPKIPTIPVEVEVENIFIANIPFVEGPSKGTPKPSWNEIKESLPALKEVGINTIFLWGPWERAANVDNITVYTDEGEIQLPVGFALHGKDYLRLDPDRGSEAEFMDMIETAHSLEMKIIAHLQMTIAIPGDFVYEKHPDWMLKSIYGKPAVTWPWTLAHYGYVVNKAHPDLINYVTEVIIPHWVKNWDVDGIFLDSPSIVYCDPHIKDLCQKEKIAAGYDCLTPVDGYYSPEPLVKAMRAKIDQLEKEEGRDLIFAAETTLKTWRDIPDECIIKMCEGNSYEYISYAYMADPRGDWSLGEYFDWIWDYNFRLLLKRVYDGEVSSENYVKYFEMEREMVVKYTETARFVNIWNNFRDFIDLLKPDVAGCYITLAVTAPGKTVWIGAYQLPPQSDVLENYFEYDSDVFRRWYEKLILIKKRYPALQSDNIENALVSPKTKRVIAYNRWAENESVTVVINANNKLVDCIVKTRFDGDKIIVYDHISGEKFEGSPTSLEIQMSPYSSRILVLERYI